MLTDFPVHLDAPVGGVEVVARNLAELLGQRSVVDLDIVTSQADVGRPYSTQLAAGVNVHYLPRLARFELPSLFLHDRLQLRRTLRSLSPDVVHVHGLGRYAFAAFGWPYVLTIHGVTAAEHRVMRRGLSSRILLRLHAHVESASVRQANVVIANSSYVARRLPRWVRARTRMIPNPIDPLFFCESAASPVAQRITWVGRVHPLKGIEYLVRALPGVREVLPAAHVKLVGPVQDARYAAYLRELASKVIPRDTVEFVGALSGRDLRTAYGQAAVVVLPSLQENAPLSVMEAMAVGRPVVATRVGGLEDLVQDDVTGALCAPADSASLAEALVRVLADERSRQRLAESARSNAEQAFDPTAVVASHEAVYHELVARGRQAA
jgi:glycosyltransferase involved in cell wall biosynthesis